MRELTIGQRDTIRLAYNAAAKSLDDTVIQNRIHQLSRDFGISEDEVRSIANGDEVKPAPAAESKSKRGGTRNDWTAEQLRKLMEMHNEGKGAAAIAKALGCDVKRVSMKLYNLKKSEVLRKPSTVKQSQIVPPSAPAEKPSAPESEKPGVSPSDEEIPAPPAEDRGNDFPEDLAEEDGEYTDSEYETALTKLAEPEPKGIKLLTEITELTDHLECAYSAKIGLLQANPAAGWASCSFEAFGRQYSVSLRERRNKE